ncbi:hypothetical protein [Halobacteriovorax marinus]|uniref:hypothetical protein n=1 Tax=Halobacteriovorax marinus TaxID=97084 RepID=UPI003A90859E
MNKIYILLIYLLVIFGIINTDGLYQNNDENLLIPNDKEARHLQNDSVVFEMTDSDKSLYFEEVLDELDIEYQIIDSKSLSKKNTKEEIDIFYKKFPELDMKLKSKDGYVYIITLSRDQRKEQARFIEQVLKDYPDIRISGLPYLNYEIGRTTQDIKKVILPLLLLISFGLLLLFVKNIYQSVILFAFPLSSISVSLNIIKYLYGEANLLSNLAPLVNFVVVFCLVIHLYFSLVEFKSFTEVKKHKIVPIIFMLVTTLLGIFSLYISHVPAIRIFAIVTTISLGISSLYTLFLFPLFELDILSSNKRSFDLELSPPKVHKSLTYGICILPFLTFYLTLSGLEIQVDALYFFPKSAKVVENIQYVENEVVGTPILEIKLRQFDFEKNYSDLSKVESLEKRISKIFGKGSLVISKIQTIKNANYVYSGEKVLPKYIQSAKVLLGMSPHIHEINDEYSITVLGKSVSTTIYKEKVREVEEYLKQSNIKYEFYGNYYNLMTSQSEIISTLLKSFLASLTLISLFVGFYLKSIKGLFQFLIINISPPLLTLSLFSIFNLTLNLATIMTFSVSFGLIVDSTIHVIYAARKNLSQKQRSTTVYLPVLLSSIILFIGFSTFIFHGFAPIWQFGTSISITILFGFIYDFYILPNFE